MANGDIKRKILRIFVGLSGGVDSAVSAALLKNAGYDVTGVFIKVWQPDWVECTWKEERREAMRAAAHLGIKFETLDLSKEYKQDVIDCMIREYSLGRTPNPDVMCNRHVKFGAFWEWAKEKKADYVATGHYARVVSNYVAGPGSFLRAADRQRSLQKEPGPAPYHLLIGIDSNKDQSYFLWTLNQDDLSHILFPVGHLTKPEVRKLAKKLKLPNAEKKDSQGLCFIGKVDLKDFLMHYIKSNPGKVVNENGEIIGNHPGALFFTIGERHGFTITSKTPNDKRYYVIAKNIDRNEITVSEKERAGDVSLNNRIVKLRNVNWVKGLIPEASINARRFYLKGRGRYRQTLSDIRIVSASLTDATIEYAHADETLAAGQSLVIYDGEECVGGGVIE